MGKGLKSIIVEKLNKLKDTGFFAIVLSNIFAKMLTFFGGMVLVRLLTKSEYGIYTDIMNNYGILFILNDFGCGVAMMQYRSENYSDKEKNNDYFTKAYKYGMLSTSVASMLLLFSPLFYPFKQSASVKLTQSLFLLPFFSTTNSFVQTNLLVKMKNKKYAVINILQTFIHYGVLLPFSFFLNLRGAVFANYVIAIILLIISVIISNTDLKFNWKSNILSRDEKKGFLKFALGSQLNNSIGGMLNLFDIFLIGLIVANSESIASYKVASTIPQALLFVPNSIIIYIVPYFAGNSQNKKWVKANYKIIIALCSLINGTMMLMCIILSGSIIPYIYGTQYNDAVFCFKVLMCSFFFNGSIYLPTANIIYTQHKVRVNIVLTIISNVVNCAMDVLLINSFGSIGAAYSTLIVSCVSAIISLCYMTRCFRTWSLELI